MSFLSETHRENKEQRIKRDGPFAERLRQSYVKTLQSHMAAFYEHGSSIEITFLIEAFEQLEHEVVDRIGNKQPNLISTLRRLLDASVISFQSPTNQPQSKMPATERKISNAGTEAIHAAEPTPGGTLRLPKVENDC